MIKFYKLLLISLILTTSIATRAQNGWVYNNINQPIFTNLKAVNFYDSDTGYVIGNMYSTSAIYKTTNGGQSWATDTFLNNTNLNALEIKGNNVYVAGSLGKVYRHTVGGASGWTLLTTGATFDIYDVFFVDSVGYIAGTSGNIRRTTNYGNSWTNPTITGFNYDVNGVYFTDQQNGFVVGTYNFFQGFIARTVSGGQYWSVPLTIASKMNALDFTSSNIGYAVGNGGTIYKTINAGVNWAPLTLGNTSNLLDVFFVNDTLGYIVGENCSIFKTTNGGASWVTQSYIISTIPVSGVYFFDAENGIAVSDSLVYVTTTTGGVNLSVSIPDYDVYCSGYTNIQPTVTYNGLGTVSYSWASSTLLSDTSILNPTAGPINNTTTFYLTVTDGILSATDSTIVSIVPLPSDSICIVTVEDTNNVIVFEQHVAGPISHYNVYKETSVAGIYAVIGQVHPDSAGIFVDSNSNVAVHADRYKISTVDSCGNESLLSDYHKTMHLSVNQGIGTSWNLLWNQYEGMNVITYKIYRGDSLNNLVAIDSVSGSLTSYTDQNPPSGGLYYQVEIVSDYVCQPYLYSKANTNYNTSRSNKADNGMIAPPIPLVADFSATPQTGTAPLNVQFTDASQGLASTHFWDFGDGDTSWSMNPSHIYTSAGVYNVTLIIASATDGDTIVKTAFIDVISGIDQANLNDVTKIYPNPASSGKTVFVETGVTQMKEISLVDLTGKEVFKRNDIDATRYELKLDDSFKGVYFLKIVTKGNKTLVKKLVVK